MSKNTKTTDTTPKVKQPTPQEKALALAARGEAAVVRAQKALDTAKDAGADEETVAYVADLVAETEAHSTSATLAATNASTPEVPHVRRVNAATRAKHAAEAAEETAELAEQVLGEGESERVEAELAELENVPGYSKNARWLELQERREQLRFA